MFPSALRKSTSLRSDQTSYSPAGMALFAALNANGTCTLTLSPCAGVETTPAVKQSAAAASFQFISLSPRSQIPDSFAGRVTGSQFQRPIEAAQWSHWGLQGERFWSAMSLKIMTLTANLTWPNQPFSGLLEYTRVV